jgi:hypothetical protein
MVTKTRNKVVESVYERPLMEGRTMSQIVQREGALKVLNMPSRMGNTLYYPDGRVVKDGK